MIAERVQLPDTLRQPGRYVTAPIRVPRNATRVSLTIRGRARWGRVGGRRSVVRSRIQINYRGFWEDYFQASATREARDRFGKPVDATSVEVDLPRNRIAQPYLRGVVEHLAPSEGDVELAFSDAPLAPIPRGHNSVAHDGELDRAATMNSVDTVSFTGGTAKTTAGSNRCAILHAGWWHGDTAISSITYGGSAMTLVVGQTHAASGNRATLYRFLNPPTTGTTVTITWGGDVFGSVACSSYNNVDQTTPVSNTAAANSNSVSCTSANGEMVVDCNKQWTTPTVGAGQTQIHNQGPSGDDCASSRELSTGSSVTMSWGGNDNSVIVAASLKEASAGQNHAVSTASFSFTGVAPTITKSAAVALASLALAGVAPTTAKVASAPIAAIAFSGVAPTAPQSHAVAVAALAIVGATPTTYHWVEASPSSVVNVSAGGSSVNWTNPGNAAASDDSYATSSISAVANPTGWLRATGFGFSLPDGVAPIGYLLSVERKASGASEAGDLNVFLVLNGAQIGSDYQTSFSGNIPTSDTVVTFGALTNANGTSLSASDIEDADFGFEYQAGRFVGSPTVSVDSMKLAVAYNPAITADVPVATLSFTGVAPTTAKSAEVGLATMALSGVVPTAVFSAPVSIASLAFSGVVPATAKSSAVDVGIMSFAGVAPSTAKAVSVDVGTVNFSGAAPTTTKAAAVSVATVTFAGVVPDTIGGTVPFATLTFSGVPATTAKSAAVDVAGLAVSGIVPTTAKSAAVDLASLAIAGVAPTVSKAAAIDAAAMTFSGVHPETGNQADVPAAVLALAGIVPETFFVATVPAATITWVGIVPGTVIAGLTGHLGGQVSVAAALGGVIGISPAIGGRVIVLPGLGGPVELN
jgi:hypothetical protein